MINGVKLRILLFGLKQTTDVARSVDKGNGSFVAPMLQSPQRGSHKMHSYSQTVRLLLVFAIVLLSVPNAGAQSGRKVRKNTPPIPAPAPETEVAKPKESPDPALTLVVGMSQPDVFDSTSIPNPREALLSLEERLDDHPGVKVVPVPREIGVRDAIRRAKSEKEAYVVLLELSVESMGRMGSELRLSYTVFSPVTGKIKTSGQTYPRMYGNRGVIMNPRAESIYGDKQVHGAARDAAERILKAFHLHVSLALARN